MVQASNLYPGATSVPLVQRQRAGETPAPENQRMDLRRPFVGGNWKMHLTRAGAARLAQDIAADAHNRADAVETVVFPAFVHLDAVGAALRSGGQGVGLGAQDVWPEPEGAYTGEVSVPMLADLGVAAVLTGHSERRHVVGEGDALVAAKTRAVLAADLTCVLCVGETLEQREAGETDAINESQLRAAIAGLSANECRRLVVAYEPVWAIGTGKTASPDDAQAAHATIRAVLADALGSTAASATRIIYGGSVKPDNADALLAQPDIDGALVGGASLDASAFLAIRSAARTALETLR